MMMSFGDLKSVELTDGERKGQDPWSFYTFGSPAPGAPIFDLSEICGGVFCGFSGGHCTRGSTWDGAIVKTGGIYGYDAFLGH